MSMPTFGQLSFTATGHLLIAETAIEFQRTTIAIKAEIPNENHALRSARIACRASAPPDRLSRATYRLNLAGRESHLTQDGGRPGPGISLS
jgi:hypothetical protein